MGPSSTGASMRSIVVFEVDGMEQWSSGCGCSGTREKTGALRALEMTQQRLLSWAAGTLLVLRRDWDANGILIITR